MGLDALKDLGNKYKGKLSAIKNGVYESKMGKYITETGKETVKAMGLKGVAVAAGTGLLAASYFSGSMESTYDALINGAIPNAFPRAELLTGVTLFSAGSAMLSNAVNYAKRGGKKISDRVEKTKEALADRYQGLKNNDSNKLHSRNKRDSGTYTNIPESDVQNRLWAHQDTIADLKRAIEGNAPKRTSKEYMKTDPGAFKHYQEEGKGTSNSSRITYTTQPKDKVIENTTPEQIGFNGVYDALGRGKKQDISKKPLSERTLNELTGYKKENGSEIEKSSDSTRKPSRFDTPSNAYQSQTRTQASDSEQGTSLLEKIFGRKASRFDTPSNAYQSQKGSSSLDAENAEVSVEAERKASRFDTASNAYQTKKNEGNSIDSQRKASRFDTPSNAYQSRSRRENAEVSVEVERKVSRFDTSSNAYQSRQKISSDSENAVETGRKASRFDTASNAYQSQNKKVNSEESERKASRFDVASNSYQSQSRKVSSEVSERKASRFDEPSNAYQSRSRRSASGGERKTSRFDTPSNAYQSRSRKETAVETERKASKFDVASNAYQSRSRKEASSGITDEYGEIIVDSTTLGKTNRSGKTKTYKNKTIEAKLLEKLDKIREPYFVGGPNSLLKDKTKYTAKKDSPYVVQMKKAFGIDVTNEKYMTKEAQIAEIKRIAKEQEAEMEGLSALKKSKK